MSDRSATTSRTTLLIWTSLGCSFSVALLVCRIHWSGAGAFHFLAWNLALALIPLGFSTLALAASRARWKWVAVLFLGPWLLFFPNAPYILTDLMHLKARHPIPLWYDLTLLLSFALNGLFLGYLSLRMAESVLEQVFDRTTALLATLAVMFLSAFGIYLGRFERWNSWDLWYHPRGVAADILPALMHPVAHARLWAMTVLFGTLLYAGYRMARGVGSPALSATPEA